MKADKEDIIIEMLRQMNSRFDDMNGRIDDINTRIGDMYTRIDAMNDRITELKDDYRDLERKVDRIYEDRKEVTVKFSRAFAGINAAFSMVVAIFAVLIFGNK